MMSDNQFTKENVDKYTNYLITSQRYRTPPYEWSEGIFQRYKPISGDFPIGNNFFGDEICNNNNPTGRGISANSCGYWENTNNRKTIEQCIDEKRTFRTLKIRNISNT